MKSRFVVFLISRVGIGLVGVDSRWILMWVGAVLFQYSFHWDIIVSLASFGLQFVKGSADVYRMRYTEQFSSE